MVTPQHATPLDSTPLPRDWEPRPGEWINLWEKVESKLVALSDEEAQALHRGVAYILVMTEKHDRALADKLRQICGRFQGQDELEYILATSILSKLETGEN